MKNSISNAGNTTPSRREPHGEVVLPMLGTPAHHLTADGGRPGRVGAALPAGLSERSHHLRQGLLEPLLHQLTRQPQHPVAHATEVPVPPRVSRCSPPVHLAVDLDHELRPRRHEVSDVAAQHHLPPKPHPELLGPERLPEQRLGGGGRRPKGGGPSDDDSVRCAHDDLPSPAPWPGFGVPWRRGRDALARSLRCCRSCSLVEIATRHRARRATCASQPQPGQGVGRRAKRTRLALRAATGPWESATPRSLSIPTTANVAAHGMTARLPHSETGSMARDRDGGGRQPTFKRSQRSTYAELPHSPAGAIAPRTNRGELVRRAGATPRAPAGGGIINDALRRPTHQYLQIGAAPETLLQRTLYGESHPTPEPNNLRGKPIRHYDEAGALKSESHDFKGNPLVTQRNLAQAFTAATDWAPLATATTPSTIDAAAAALLETETFTQTRTFDALNRIASATEPDLTELKPRYNQRGLLDKVEARIRNSVTWTPFVDDLQYDAKAQRQSIDYGNGTQTAYQYDELTYRLLHLTTTRTSPSNTLQDLSYTFDPVGNIVQITDAAQQTLFYNNSVVLPQNLFEYDALYRLLSATGREHASIGDVQVDHNDLPLQNLPHNNDASAVRTYLEEYQYDAVGNILEMFHEAAGTPVATWTRAYTYAVGTNRLATNTIPGGTATYTHDAHGNLSSMPHLASIEWTPFDQIRTCDLGGGGDVYFTYASDGQRVRKVWQQTASAVKERIYLGAYEIYREKLSGVTQLERQTLHVMAGVQRIAMVETKTIEGGAPIATPVPKHRFQLGNHLGSAMLEVDETGLIISYEEYLPYGNSAYRSARSGVEVSARRYRYTGKERDEETGLYYHGARYYACWIARWTSADPLGLQAGLNLYLYGRASPVVYVDPSGMFDVMAMANLGQTAATNAAISAADAEARSWAPDSSDSLNAETARPSTEYDPNAAAVAMAEPPPRSAPTEFTEPGNMGFGTNLVSPGDLYEQAQLDAGNAWRQEVIERQDYSERDIRGHKLWTQNAQTGKMELTPDRYLELPVGTSDVEVQLALGGAAKALGAVLSRLSAGSAVVEAGTARVASSDASSGGLPMAPKSWQDFLPEAQKRLQATKQRLGNPSGDIVAMAMPRKKALERIESLAPQVEKHLEKIANQPGSRDVPHWRTEIQAWLKSMEEAAPHTGKKTSAEVAERIAEWKRRLGD
jgi:RHS repeat-associated protein